MAFICSGCFSFETASTETLRRSSFSALSGTPREHIVVSNYGWYLFNCIPLVCGNPRKGATFPWVFFRDCVTTDVVQNRITEYAASKGANLAELNLFATDNVLFELPGTSVPIPMPYVLCYHERLISAILMDPPPAAVEAPQASVPVPLTTVTKPQPFAPRERQPVPPAAVQQSAAGAGSKNDLKQLLDSIPDGGVK